MWVLHIEPSVFLFLVRTIALVVAVLFYKLYHYIVHTVQALKVVHAFMVLQHVAGRVERQLVLDGASEFVRAVVPLHVVFATAGDVALAEHSHFGERQTHNFRSNGVNQINEFIMQRYKHVPACSLDNAIFEFHTMIIGNSSYLYLTVFHLVAEPISLLHNK